MTRRTVRGGERWLINQSLTMDTTQIKTGMGELDNFTEFDPGDHVVGEALPPDLRR
jgi:hypothetical protein